MSLAAHPLKILVALTDIAGDEIDGINTVSFGPNRTMLETTDFMDTTGAKTRMAGLRDGTVQLSGAYESADTGQARLRTLEESGASAFVRILWNGTTGHKVECIVESFAINASVDGLVEFSATLQFNGAPAAV